MRTPETIQIQSVLFDQDAHAIDRHVRGMSQSIAVSRASRFEVEIVVELGDCSESPLLDPSIVDHLRTTLVDAGARSLGYRHFGQNLGHGGGQNRLFQLGNSVSFYAIVNPDTCMSPDYLLGLLAPMADQSIGITEGRQIPLEHQKVYDLQTGDTSWASGACMLARSVVVDQIGGFDDDTFFMYCDDVDFSWRARLAGHRVVHQPLATLFHDKRLSPQGTYLPSEFETYHSSLASVLIGQKYSRPDVVAARLVDLDGSPEEVHARVAAEYRAREQSGHLPVPLDPSGLVAQFQTYAYADLRFDYRF